MKKHCLSSLLLLFLIPLLTSQVLASYIAPIVVSTEWLAANLNNLKVVALDIRKIEDYQEGHIPGAVSAYYGIWVTSAEGRHTDDGRSF